MKYIVAGSVVQHVGRDLAESVPWLDVCQRRPRVGVPGEILQIDYIAAPLGGDSQRRDVQRMDGDVRVEAEGGEIPADEPLDRPGGTSARTGIRVAAFPQCRWC